MPKPKYYVVQFYAELLGFRPTIWRRFQVRADITVARLGYILQVLFEMKARHLMAIEVPKGANFCAFLRKEYPNVAQNPAEYGKNANLVARYEFIDFMDRPHLFQRPDEFIADARLTPLEAAFEEIDYNFMFYYDFGDGWQIRVTREAVFTDAEAACSVREQTGGAECPAVKSVELPRVLEGECFGIVEDVGGIAGLTEFVKAFKKKQGASYKHYSEWFESGDFDITAFDLDDMNFRLKKIPRIYKEIYEDDLEPTQRSIDLIERAYIKKNT